MRPFRFSLAVLFLIVALVSSSFAQTWRHNGPWGSNATVIQVCPSDSTIIYQGTKANGVWRSVDGGMTWQRSSGGLPTVTDSLDWWFGDYAEITTLAIHPDQPGTVWAGVKGNGLFSSVDGGLSWGVVEAGLPASLNVSEVVYDPDSTFHIYLAVAEGVHGGLYQSLDEGESWQLTTALPNGTEHGISSVFVNPASTNHVLASASNMGAVYESYDYGVGWDSLSAGQHDIKQVVIDPIEPEVLFARAVNGEGESVLIGRFNYGADWYPVPNDNPWVQVNYLSMGHDGTVYVQVADSLLRGDDGGWRWDPIFVDVPKERESTQLCVEVNPLNPDRVFLANRYGVFKSNNRGNSYTLCVDGIDNISISSVIPHPTDPLVATAISKTGIWRTENRGESWTILLQGTFSSFFHDPLYPDTLYAGGMTILRSYNGGQSWEDLETDFDTEVTALACHPVYTQMLYAGGRQEFHASNNYGDTWDLQTIEYADDEAIKEVHAGVVYDDDIYFGHIGIHYSINSGRNWDWISAPFRIWKLEFLESALRMYGVLAQVVNEQPFIGYSTDGGYTWSVINQGVPSAKLSDLEMNPQNNSHLLITSEYGVFSTWNHGADWTRLEGPYDYRTTELAFSCDNRTLYVGTNTHGIWSATDLVSSVENEVEQQPCQLLINTFYPNPFNSSTRMNMTTPEGTNISAKVYNVLGKEIRTLFEGRADNNELEVIWNGVDTNGNHVSSGVYIVELRSANLIKRRKVVCLK